MQDTEPTKNDGVSRTGGAMKATDLVFIDTETTGLDPRKHELIEIAVVRVRQTWDVNAAPVFSIVDEWSSKIRPENIQSADPASLRVNGFSASGWEDAPRAADVLNEFTKRAEGAIMVAHNVAFDAGFIDTYLAVHQLPNKMHYHRLDTVSMAYAKLHDTDVTRYSLGELCKYFGIVNESAHSALSDARACFELFKKLMAL
jgi:DNA polymerase III epsilon subunit family exonuclease